MQAYYIVESVFKMHELDGDDRDNNTSRRQYSSASLLGIVKIGWAVPGDW